MFVYFIFINHIYNIYYLMYFFFFFDIHVDINWSLRTKTKIKNFCEDENIQYYFVGTTIKICNIYKDEKLN